MKEYIKPEFEVKSIVQDVNVANESLPDGEYGGQIIFSTPNSWWPF